jgi:4-amino-4-deoxy-L-arabinose transferase-like glycosyltransferase
LSRLVSYYGLPLVLVVHLVLRLAAWEQPLVRDVGAYAYVGSRLLAGEVLYRDLPDIKFPVTYYLLAVAFALGGATENTVRCAAALAGLLGVLAFFFLARELLGPRWGLVSAAVYAVSVALPGVQGTTAQMEVFMLPLLLGSTVLAWRGYRGGRSLDWFLAGLLLGLAVSCKQVAGVNMLLYLVLLGVRRREVSGGWPVRSTAWLGLGLVLPPVGWAVLLAAQGAFGDGIFWTITFVGLYSAHDYDWTYLGSVLRSTGAVAVENPLLWLAGVIFVVRYLVDRERTTEGRLVLWFLAVSLVGVMFPSKFYNHYFLQLIPALSLAAGLELRRLGEQFREGKAGAGAWFGGVLLAAGVFWALIPPAEEWRHGPAWTSRYRADTFKFLEARQVGVWLREHAAPEERLLVWGREPAVYFYAGKKAPLQHFFVALFTWQVPDETWDQVVGLLDHRPPEWVAVGREFLRAPGGNLLSVEEAIRREQSRPRLGAQPAPAVAPAITRERFLHTAEAGSRLHLLDRAVKQRLGERYVRVFALHEYELYRLVVPARSP